MAGQAGTDGADVSGGERPGVSVQPPSTASSSSHALSSPGATAAARPSKPNPFGAARPREQVIAERKGVTEADLLRELASKEWRPTVVLSEAQKEEQKAAEAELAFARDELARAPAGEEARRAELEGEVKAREGTLQDLLASFEVRGERCGGAFENTLKLQQRFGGELLASLEVRGVALLEVSSLPFLPSSLTPSPPPSLSWRCGERRVELAALVQDVARERAEVEREVEARGAEERAAARAVEQGALAVEAEAAEDEEEDAEAVVCRECRSSRTDILGPTTERYPTCRVALPCLSRCTACCRVALPCQTRRPAGRRVALLPARRIAACALPCPARAEPPCYLHRLAVRRPAARAALLLPALLLPALLRVALLASALLAAAPLPAPPCRALAAHHSSLAWLTRDAAASLAVCNHLPLAERAHFGLHKTAKALYDAVVARYSSPITAALGRLILPYLFPELSAFATVEDLVTHLRTSNAHYRSALPAEDHFLVLDPTDLTVDMLEKHLLAAKTSVVAVGAARGNPRTPFFEGCPPSPVAPSYASATVVDIFGAEDVGAASALSGKRHSSKCKVVGVVAGVGASVAAVVAAVGVGVAVVAEVGVVAAAMVAVGVELFRGEWFALRGAYGSRVRCPYVIRTGDRAGQTCRKLHTQHRCFSCLDDAWCAEFGDEAELHRWLELLRFGVAIFALDYDAIHAAMYALSISADGDCYLYVPPDPRIEAAAQDASESALPGTARAEALDTFTLDSGASRCFFRDSTTLTPLLAPVPVRLADPSGGPVLARSSTVLPCPAVQSGSLSSLHLPSFSTKLVSASGPIAAPCSCRLLSHQTLLWHHCLGHPSLPRLCGMHSRLLISGLPRSLPPLPPSPAPPCLPCVEGRQRAAPHSSSFSPTTAPLQTLHMDVKGEVPDVLIRWISAVRLQLRERFHPDLPFLRLHSNRGGEFSSDILRDFCRGEGILNSFTLPTSPHKNGVAERRIGLVMEVAHTSMIHAAAPHFLWPFAVRLVMRRCSGSRALFYHPTLRRVLPSQDVTFDESVPFYRVSQVDPLSGSVLVKVGVDSGAARGDASGGAVSVGTVSRGAEPASAEPEGADPGGAESEGAEFGGAEPGGTEPEGAEPGGAEPRGTASAGGPAGASPRLSPRREPLSPQQLHEWFSQRTRLRSDAAGAGDSAARGTRAGGTGATSLGGAGVTAGAGGIRGAGAAGPGGARTRGTGAAGAGGVGGAGAGVPGAGDPGAGGIGAGGTGVGDAGARGTGAGDSGPGGTSTGGAGAGGAGAGNAGAGGTSVGGAGAGGAGVGDSAAGGTSAGGSGAGGTGASGLGAGGTVQRRSFFVPPPSSSLPPPDSIPRQVSYLVLPDLFALFALVVVFLVRVLLLSPALTLWHFSDLARAASPTVPRLLATIVIDPSFESAAAFALVAELVDFTAACRLDYATALVAGSKSASPPSVGGECALGTDVVEDRQVEF
ncbi:unnamed protein product [Closterium sp. NIES-53]